MLTSEPSSDPSAPTAAESSAKQEKATPQSPPKAPPEAPKGYRFRPGTPSELHEFYRESSERWRYFAVALGLMWAVVSPLAALSALLVPMIRDIRLLGPLEETFEETIDQLATAVALLPFAAIVLLVSVTVFVYVRTQYRRSQQAKQDLIWIAERTHQFVGIAWLSPQKDHLTLPRFFIHPAHRNRGVGSQLLWQLLTDSRITKHHGRNIHPLIKVVCEEHLQHFYQCFGFKSSDLKSSRHARKVSLYLSTQPRFLPGHATNSSALSEGLWPAGSLVRPVRSYRERWLLYKMFWSNKQFRQSVLLLLTVSLMSVMGCWLLSTGLGWLVAPIAQKITLSSIVSGIQESSGSRLKLLLFLIPLTAVSAISLAQKVLFTLFFIKVTVGSFILWMVLLTSVVIHSVRWWRDWVIVHHHKAVGYLHIERHSKYSLLHCLHVEPAGSRHLFHLRALVYLQHRIGLPLYVACTSESASFYKKIGFQPAKNKEKLPLGVKIISRFRTQLLALSAPDLPKILQIKNKAVKQFPSKKENL